MLKKNPLTFQLMNTIKHPDNFISILERQLACLHLYVPEPTVFLEFTTKMTHELCEFIRRSFPALLSSNHDKAAVSVL